MVNTTLIRVSRRALLFMAVFGCLLVWLAPVAQAAKDKNKPQPAQEAVQTTDSSLPLCPNKQIVPSPTPCRCADSAITAEGGGGHPECLGYTPQIGDACANQTATECLSHERFVQDIQKGVDFLSALVGIAVVGNLILGGVQYAASGDKPETLGAARKRISNSLIALAIWFLLAAFIEFLIPGGILN